MLTFKVLTTLLLLCGSSYAAPQVYVRESAESLSLDRRQDSSNSTDNSTTTPILEPVVPPNVNPADLSILTLDNNVNLAFGGTLVAGADRSKAKRADGVYAAANLTLQYPTVPLDHSLFVSNIACSGGVLTGTLSSNAYGFAKPSWSKAANIIFITAVDGCGKDSENHLFHATSVTFSDTDSTFSATGSSVSYSDVVANLNVQWGAVPASNLRRSRDKRAMFGRSLLEPHFRETITFSWDVYAQDILGTDIHAPWDDAVLILDWSSEGGEKDDSYKKGEVASSSPGGHHKRSNQTWSDVITREEGELIARKDDEGGFSYGLALYCVDCGFK